MKKIIFFAIVLITIASCRKTTSGSSTNNGLISELVELDTTLSAPADTSFVVKFTYDNLNRVTQEIETEYDLPVISVTQTQTYYYNSSDTVPYKSVVYENSPDSAAFGFDADLYDNGTTNGTSTMYYFYSSGRLIEDSTIGDNYERVNNYSYVNNFVIRDQASINNGISAPVYIDTFYQARQGDNLINQIDTLYRPIADIDEGFTYQFDNHPNPLYNKIIAPFSVITIDGLDDSPEQQNNYTALNEYSNKADSSSLTSSNETYIYTYRSDGYPESAIAYDNFTGTPLYDFKMVYIYNK